MESVTGGCLCGKVTFKCDMRFHQFHLCHCVQCQKSTSTAFAANLFTEVDNIRWLSGSDLIKRFDLPGRAISKAFCVECGSGVPYLSKTGKALVVPAGSLDEPVNIEPQDNIFYAERACWLQQGIRANKFDKFSADDEKES